MTGRVNVSLSCGGRRPAMHTKEEELLIAAPRGTAMFDVLASGA